MFLFRNVLKCSCLFVTVCFMTRDCQGIDLDFQEEFLKREYSLSKPYRGLGFSSSSQWDLMGTAMVTTDHVRLTPDLQSRQGAVWSRIPLVLRDWELKVHFKIHGLAKKNLNGDGMAIWLTKDRMQDGRNRDACDTAGYTLPLSCFGASTIVKMHRGDVVICSTAEDNISSGANSLHFVLVYSRGSVFGSKNYFVGLGIFVDTYPNSEKLFDRTFPYISVTLGNGTLSYNHNQDGRPSELGGCAAMARNSIYDNFLLIKYTKNRLTVMVDVDGKQEWRICADITGLRLPLGYYLGASAATGELSDNHDLISIKLYQLTVERTAAEKDNEEEVTLPRVDDMKQFEVIVEEEGMTKIQFFFMLLFAIVGLIVMVVAGFFTYRCWTEKKRKHFY